MTITKLALIDKIHCFTFDIFVPLFSILTIIGILKANRPVQPKTFYFSGETQLVTVQRTYFGFR